MDMYRSAYYGNPFLGLFYRANDSVALAPIDAQHKNVDAIKEALKVEVMKLSIAGTNLLGAYTAMNNNGIIVPNIIEKSEIDALKAAGLNVHVSSELHNAHGNNLCVNDKAGMISPRIDSAEKKRMEDALGIGLTAMCVANYPTVGSTCICTNKGFLAHYAIGEKDVEAIGDALGVPGSRGTLNMGVGFLGICLVHNSRGFVAGETSSGFELGKVEGELGYL